MLAMLRQATPAEDYEITAVREHTKSSENTPCIIDRLQSCSRTFRCLSPSCQTW
jgi:hypothetical protein